MTAEVIEQRATAAPTLGGTAHAIWWAWKQEQYQGGTACFGHSPTLGELTWQPDGLNRVVGQHLVRKLTPDQEDAVWAELMAGRLRIYRRRNAPLSGASSEPTQILHETTGCSIPSGLSSDE